MAPESGPTTSAHTQQPNAASLKAWWRQFTLVQRLKTKPPSSPPGAVFGVPLRESLRYASVQISTANQNGELFVWGYIPVVVAKCGLFLKEKGTEVEGIFRVSGSSKRMRELQTIFESPPRYGKNIQWNELQFTPHDVASVFRRFLTQMPEPIIPHSLYHDFRNAYSKSLPASEKRSSPLAESDMNKQTAPKTTPPKEITPTAPRVNESELIATYKKLISQIPLANQYLLLYILDLLTVFAKKSDMNKMPATNLAVIFRPAVINHPSHEMSPEHHKLSQEVLEFLIEKQDWFMLDIPPPPRQDSILTSQQHTNNASQPNLPSHQPTPNYLGDPLPTEDDVYVGPASDEDEDGWRLVQDDGAASVGRRRTFSERGIKQDMTSTGRKSVDNAPSRGVDNTPFRSAGNLSTVNEGTAILPTVEETGENKKTTTFDETKAEKEKGEKRGRSSVKLWGTVKRSRTVEGNPTTAVEHNVLRKRNSRADVK